VYEIVITDFLQHRSIIKVGEGELYVGSGEISPDDSEAIQKVGRETVQGFRAKVEERLGICFCAKIKN
jgi:hypothetical protein